MLSECFLIKILISDSSQTHNIVKPVRRAVPKVEALTPKCRKIYNVYKKTRKLLHFTCRAKKALQFSKAQEFEKKISKMNPLVKKLFCMQLNLCTKKEQARRFTTDEKLIALTILKQGPKSYRFLKKIFILPSETTLRKLISGFQVDSGINEKILHIHFCR